MIPEQVFRLLGDATRLRIVNLLLKQPRGAGAGDIAEEVRAKGPAVSQHLKLLRGGGLLRSERRGRNVVYRIDPSARPVLRALLDRTPKRGRLRLSARNRLLGTVTAVERDGITAAVTLDVGGQSVYSVVTKAALDDLGLEVGDGAYAVVKATEVMLMR